VVSENASVPFNRRFVTGRELAYIEAAMAAGALSGPGPFSEACQKLICVETGAPRAFLVPTCTAALEMSAILLDIGPGDEVVLPSFTLSSTANAVVLRGGTPVFVDIDPVTFNLDPDAIEAAITPRTRSIFVTHYAGVPADMARIMDLAVRHRLSVVEDAAQAYGASRDGRPAGSFAALACFSFGGLKNISAGEAGALIINDPSLLHRAATFRDKGTDRARFLAGQVAAYTWQDSGSAQIVNELTAAYLLAQLESAASIQSKRLLLWQRYVDGLSELATAGHFGIPAPPKAARHNAHIFFLVMPDRQSRARLKEFLRMKGITSVSHYEPLHLSPAGLRFGRTVGRMDVTERVANCILRLPLYNDLDAHQERVIAAVRDWAMSRLK
jgi:dTDP-4-amino-4,6-dideoxygalactose transaminase